MLHEIPFLSLIIFLPLVGVVFILMIRGNEQEANWNAWAVGILTSGVNFLLTLILFFRFDPSHAGFQFVEKHSWISVFHLFYYIGVDGISVLFVLLSTFLILLALLASCSFIQTRSREYVIAFLVSETMMIGTFCALDIVLFYLFFEGVLIPMFFIIGIWGGEHRIYAALKFFLYTFLGSVLMLIAVLTLAILTGTTLLGEMKTHTLPFSTQVWLWGAFFASFAIKLPMWPFHTWLPDAHVEAPTGGSMILAGVLLKMGGYGFLRIALPLFPDASQYFASLMWGLSVVAVIYTSCIALAQTDIKKLIAYSSVAHMGLVTFGLFTFSVEGVQGALFQMISHGVVSAGLFWCVGVIYHRHPSRAISEYGGLIHRMPVYASLFLVFLLASVGLPGTSGFLGEILVFLSAYSIQGWLAVGIGSGMVLGAGYSLWLYKRVMLGPLEKEKLKFFSDLTPLEKSVGIPLLLTVIFLGIIPSPLFKCSEQAIRLALEPYTSPYHKQSPSVHSMEKKR